MLRHIVVGLLVGLALGLPYEYAGGPFPAVTTLTLCIVGMFASTYAADRRRQ